MYRIVFSSRYTQSACSNRQGWQVRGKDKKIIYLLLHTCSVTFPFRRFVAGERKLVAFFKEQEEADGDCSFSPRVRCRIQGVANWEKCLNWRDCCMECLTSLAGKGGGFGQGGSQVKHGRKSNTFRKHDLSRESETRFAVGKLDEFSLSKHHLHLFQ